MTRTIRTIQTVHLNLQQNHSLWDIGLKLEYPLSETTLKLDSHIDTCVLGKDAVIFLDYDCPIRVEAYDPRLGSVEYCTVSGAVAFYDPLTRRTLLLVINQTIHILHLDHHLLCTMQCRMNDVTMNDTPNPWHLTPLTICMH